MDAPEAIARAAVYFDEGRPYHPDAIVRNVALAIKADREARLEVERAKQEPTCTCVGGPSGGVHVEPCPLADDDEAEAAAGDVWDRLREVVTVARYVTTSEDGHDQMVDLAEAVARLDRKVR